MVTEVLLIHDKLLQSTWMNQKIIQTKDKTARFDRCSSRQANPASVMIGKT